MESKFNKIVIVSLCDTFTKEIAKALSQTLGMMFCDTKDLVEYELINKDAIEKLTDKKYLVQREKAVMKHIASFVDVVVSINFDYLSHNINILNKESVIIFLNVSKKYIKEKAGLVENIDYDNRTKTLKNLATITLDLRKNDSDFVCNKIIDALRGIL